MWKKLRKEGKWTVLPACKVVFRESRRRQKKSRTDTPDKIVGEQRRRTQCARRYGGGSNPVQRRGRVFFGGGKGDGFSLKEGEVLLSGKKEENRGSIIERNSSWGNSGEEIANGFKKEDPNHEKGRG